MSFTLTRAHLDSLLEPTREGNMGPVIQAMDPGCEIRWGASDQPGEGGSGVYTVESWKAKVLPWVMGVFGPGGLKFEVTAADVIGNKSIHEEVARGRMANGEEYVNRNCCVMEFSPETGKITSVRLYTDTEVKTRARKAHGFA